MKPNKSVTNYVLPHNLGHFLDPLGLSCSWVSLELVAPVTSHIGSSMHCSLSDTGPLPDTIVVPPGLVSTRLSLLRPLGWLFVWLWQILEHVALFDRVVRECSKELRFWGFGGLSTVLD